MNVSDLSCVIITFNEELNIADCIESVSNVCDEIIVVDSESTDNTVEIAIENGAKVLSRPWTGYADARNAGHLEASNDYILAIDADERLSTELLNSIEELKPQPDIIYQLDRLNYFAEKPVRHSGWYPDYVDRLYNKLSAHWRGNLVHENLISKSSKKKKLKGKLHHYSYSSVEDHNQRIEKYARLSAQKMHNKGETYSDAKKYLKAAFRYFRTLVLKGGFLDGTMGFYIARQNYRLILKKYDYLRILISKNKSKSQ